MLNWESEISYSMYDITNYNQKNEMNYNMHNKNDDGNSQMNYYTNNSTMNFWDFSHYGINYNINENHPHNNENLPLVSKILTFSIKLL